MQRLAPVLKVDALSPSLPPCAGDYLWVGTALCQFRDAGNGKLRLVNHSTGNPVVAACSDSKEFINLVKTVVQEIEEKSSKETLFNFQKAANDSMYLAS